jgi:hypothetical protein
MRDQTFEDHSHFWGSKEKLVNMTSTDHKNAIAKGIRVLGVVNDEVQSGVLTFVVVGDPYALEVKSSWVNIKFDFCNEFMRLCPRKQNLDVNLRNNLGGTKHAIAMADRLKAAGSNFALRSG